jgi:hypothetical protein
MRDKLLEFMKRIELAFPPGERLETRHHSITYNQYGNDHDGWQDRLGLHLWIDPNLDFCQTFFLDKKDFERPLEEFIAALAIQVAKVRLAHPELFPTDKAVKA